MAENTKKNKKESGLSVVKKTLKYFLPVAWKVNKGYFFTSAVRTLVNAVRPFVAIIVSPLIISELLGKRDLNKLLIYAADCRGRTAAFVYQLMA